MLLQLLFVQIVVVINQLGVGLAHRHGQGPARRERQRRAAPLGRTGRIFRKRSLKLLDHRQWATQHLQPSLHDFAAFRILLTFFRLGKSAPEMRFADAPGFARLRRHSSDKALLNRRLWLRLRFLHGRLLRFGRRQRQRAFARTSSLCESGKPVAVR